MWKHELILQSYCIHNTETCFPFFSFDPAHGDCTLLLGAAVFSLKMPRFSSFTAAHPHTSSWEPVEHHFLWTHHRFSVGLRSGDDGGHTMIFSPLIPMQPRNVVNLVFYAAWDSALSCMKIMLWLKVQFFLYDARKWAVKNSTDLADVILTPSHFPVFHTASSLCHLLCWHCSLVGVGWPFKIHLELYSSGPSSVAQRSLVNKTVWTFVFMFYFVSFSKGWLKCSAGGSCSRNLWDSRVTGVSGCNLFQPLLQSFIAIGKYKFQSWSWFYPIYKLLAGYYSTVVPQHLFLIY